MAYTQNFITLGGETLTLTVGGVTPSTTPPLAAQPFDTSEDADSDVFRPVRTQSGHLRMVSTDAATWRSFIPASAQAEPVTLKQGNTIVWQGFVQTGTYGMRFPATFEEIELPLVDMLGVLDCYDVEVSGPAEMVTIGQLLNYIFTKITSLSVDIYFSVGPSTYTTVPVWLQYQLVWRNFISKGITPTGRFSLLGLLQELCKFFGWSCRSCGTGIYFTSMADSLQSDHFIKYSVAGLLTPASDYTTASITAVTLTDADFATADHSEEYVPGYKKVTINSELNAYNALIKLPSDEIFKEYQYNTPVLGTHTQNKDLAQCWILEHGSEDFENEDVTVTSYTEANGSTNYCYGKLLIYDPDTSENKARFGWSTLFEIFRSPVNYSRQNDTPLFSITSKDTFYLGGGTLYVKGGADFSDPTYVSQGIPRAICVLRIGYTGNYKYWNGSAWTSSYATFIMVYDMSGIRNTRTSITEPEYEGYGMPIGDTMFGNIYFAVIDVEATIYALATGARYVPIMNFEIGFARVGEDDQINDKSYTATGGAFPDEQTIDTIFCTDKTKTVTGNKTIHCELGYGMLFGSQGIVDTITYGDGSQKKPEQRTADVMAAFYNQTRQVLTLSLKTSQIGALIGPANTITLGGNQYIPIASAHQWRDDVTQLKLIRK